MKKTFATIFLIISCIATLVSIFNLFGDYSIIALIILTVSIIGIIITVIILENSNKQINNPYQQQQNYYQNQMQSNYNQLQSNNYNPNMNPNFNLYPPPKKSNTAMIITLVLIGSSLITCCLLSNIVSRNYIKKSKERSLQAEQKIEEKKKAEETQKIKPTVTKAVIQKATKAKTKAATTIETITTTTVQKPEPTQLYLDFFEPYINSVGKLTPQEFKDDNNEKFADYVVNITEGNEEDLWEFEIKDSNGNYMTLWFLPDNDMYENPPEDWHWTLCLITYNDGSKEISISDEFHNNIVPVYNTSDKNREKVNQEVKSVDELKKFMFTIKENSNETIATVIETTTTATEPPVSLQFGDCLTLTELKDGDKKIVIIEAKIEASYSNKATIHTNYFNIEDLIQNKGFSQYDEIQYWAVMDMSDGEEWKVISFTVPKETIDYIYQEMIFPNEYEDYIEDLWLIPALRE